MRLSYKNKSVYAKHELPLEVIFQAKIMNLVLANCRSMLVEKQAIFIIIATILFLAFSSVCAEATPLSSPSGYQDVCFGPTVYRVPVEKYHIGATPCNPRYDHGVMVFSLILPDLTPSTSDPYEVAKWGTGTGFHKQLHISVEYGMNYISQEQALENAFAQSQNMKSLQDKDESEGKTIVRLKYLDRNHFRYLPNGCKQYEGYAIGGSMFEVCGHGDDLLVIGCQTEAGLSGGRRGFPYCKVMINYADRTQLTYSFGYEYLSYMPEIHKKLIALLDGFRLDAIK